MSARSARDRHAEPCGPGVERVAEEAEALFPDARRLILSSDTTFGVESSRGSWRR